MLVVSNNPPRDGGGRHGERSSAADRDPPVPRRAATSAAGHRALITHDLFSDLHRSGETHDRVSLWLEPGAGQDPPFAVAQLAGRTYRLAR